MVREKAQLQELAPSGRLPWAGENRNPMRGVGLKKSGRGMSPCQMSGISPSESSRFQCETPAQGSHCSL